MEKAIPLGPNQPGEIDKDVTAKVQRYASPAFLESLLNRLLVDTSGPEKQDDGVIAVDDDHEHEKEIRIQLGPYLCGSDIQSSLREFLDVFLPAQWPVGCNAHKAMLRLTACRQYEDEKLDRLLIFDTLSSGHDTFWGRVQFFRR